MTRNRARALVVIDVVFGMSIIVYLCLTEQRLYCIETGYMCPFPFYKYTAVSLVFIGVILLIRSIALARFIAHIRSSRDS
jgi:hypothetical protein